MPATLTWINPAGGNWNDARNWDRGKIPAKGDDVVIQYADVVVTYSAPFTSQIQSLECAGTLKVVSGKLEVHDTATINDLEMVSGALATEKLLQVTGDFHWTGGTLAGTPGTTSTVTLLGTTTVNGPSVKALDQVIVSNYGAFNWEQGQIRTLHNASFSNKVGAVFVAHASSQFRPTVENLGRWVIDVQYTVEFSTFNNAGNLILDTGMTKVGLFVQTSGMTRLDGGSLSSATALTFYGGQLQGGGTITASLVNAGARVVPSPTGTTGHTLVIEGNYAQSDSGVLALLLSGASSAGTFDQVLVKGSTALAGKLELRGSGLPASDTYKVLTASGVKGAFTSVTNTGKLAGTVGVSYTDTQAIVSYTPIVIPPTPTPTPTPTPEKDPTVINNGGTTGGSTSGGTANSGTATATTGANFNQTGNTLAGDFARSLLLNGGMLALTLNGSSRGDLTNSTGDAAATTFSGKLMTANLALSGGEKSASGRNTDASGLSDELFASFPLNLPELSLPSETDLLSAADLNRAMLVGGGARADILPQAGSQLSVVATLVVGEQTQTSGEESESPLTGLFISPFTLCNGSLVATLRPMSAGHAKADLSEEVEVEIKGSERVSRPQVGAALVMLTAFAGVLVGLTQSGCAAQQSARKRALGS